MSDINVQTFSGKVKVSNDLTVTTNVHADYFKGDGSLLTNLPSGSGGVWNTNSDNEIYFISSNVGISNADPGHNLSVGSNLYVDDDGSNVLVVTGNVKADYFVGDGSLLTGLSGSGGVWSTNGDGEIYFINSNVGISNADPGHNLSVGSNLYIDDDGSNVLVVTGNVKADYFSGDGSLLTNLPSGTGGVWSTNAEGEIYFINSNVGISNADPGHNLSVGSNLYVDDDGLNVLVVDGNVAAESINIGGISIKPSYPLSSVTDTGNTTPHTIEFTNAETGIVVDSNIVVAGNVTAGYLYGDVSNVTGITANLHQIVENGNVTSNTIQFTNADVSLVATGNVEANYFIGDGSQLTNIASTLQAITDSGNTTSNTVQFTSADVSLVATGNVEVGGELIVSENLTVTGNVAVDTDTLFVDSVNDRVGIRTTSPNATLHVKNETDSSGTGDVYIPGVIKKPTECLRLQNKWHNTGSGALLRFTNQHPQGTNPSTGEYNLAGIAGYDHDGGWGGGLAFYTSPGTGSGGDNLTLRMSIDSTGTVNIPGPTTGASHSDGGILYLLDTPIIDEWSWTGPTANTLRITYASTELPANCKAVLAEVFMPKSNNVDHVGHSLGKNYSSATVWTGGNQQPSTRFTLNRQTTFLDMRGDSDNFEYFYGKWFSSVIIPLDTGNTVYHIVAGESSGTSSWVYVVTRGYYI